MPDLLDNWNGPTDDEIEDEEIEHDIERQEDVWREEDAISALTPPPEAIP